ncbi:MAG TPA: AAA family ATPase, partial [Anaerolineales bacterium]
MFALVPEFIAEKARHGRNAGRLAASSLSVDISGFTHLTESLVRHGKGGAEVLAGALRTVFAPLIADVYRQGGFVANFVGDGFTALFPHAHDEDRMRLQALAAAWSICKQAANRVLIATPFGEFRFPIKAVLAEGMVDWTIWKSERIWGEQSAAFLFTGDGITDCMSGDAVAQPGEVVLSALAAQSLRRLLGEQAQLVSLGGPQPRFRLAGLSGTLPEPGKLPSKAKLDSAPFYSQSQFDSRSPGEFRPTLSMFLHLKQAPHAQFMEKMFQVLALYDGYLCRLDPHPLPESGPRLVLFWGAPTSHERDVERGLDFILDLRRAGGIPLRTGITYEVAFSGFVGAPQRQEFTCYGSRVNLAARQMDAAGWDEIWLDEQTVSRVSPAFETETPFERRFKGFSQPRPIYRLVGRREVRLAPKYPGRLVGRESALSDLQTALLPVLDGRFAGVITLRGETGSGKSRLAHTLLHTWPGAQACQVFVAQSDEVVSRSLGPLRTLLRRRFGLLNMQD